MMGAVYLAVGLAALGTASSFAAGHLGAFTPYVRRFNWTTAMP